ncbi:MAG: manganese-dependent inorganic pyrophosphatase [Candidatus Promineifilaceae bacterium]|jgi:manganese-dependent inorganic pyrophosphatase
MSVYVVGHRNPDTDAICSAIGYANLLQRSTMPDAVAAACGPCNSRTEFVLERAGVETPIMLSSVRPTARQLCHNDPQSCHAEEPFLDVYRRMTQQGLRSLPVLDAEGCVIGMLSLFDLMQELLPSAQDAASERRVRTDQARICQVLGGHFQHEAASTEAIDYTIMVAAMSKEKFVERLHASDRGQLLLVAGDRPSVQRAAITYGVRCLVLTGGFELSDTLLDTARENGVTVIISPHDTAMTVMLIKGAKLIHNAIQPKFLKFHPGARAEQIRKQVQGVSQMAFPVVDDDGRLEGVFSRADLLDPVRTQLIMVDHNELNQAVDGADEANILEVLDHHRVGGGLVTREPIRFINEIVGSTSTLVARMFCVRELEPAPGIALCLAAGIISDTLNLSSPTTTDVDRECLAWLADHVDGDLTEFTEAFFAAGSALTSSTPDQILNGDCKRYTEGPYRLSIAQVEELGLQHFWRRREELQSALDAYAVAGDLHFACLMITDITIHKSYLMVAGDDALIEAIDFPEVEDGVYELDGVVSRKKQLLPALIQRLHRIDSSAHRYGGN